MWIVGTVVLVLAGAAVTVALGWAPRPTPSPPMWNLPKVAGANAGNARTYAGFSLTSAIFIAGLTGARADSAFPTVFGMMLLSFLILVIASWFGSSIPDVYDADGEIIPSLVLVLSHMGAGLGIAVTWAALPSLLAIVGLSALVGVFVAWLLITAFGSGAWVTLVVYCVTKARARACLSVPLLSLALPALYRLVAVPLWSALWPTPDAALDFAFVALGATGLMFILYTGLLLAHGAADAEARLRQNGHRLALGASQAYAIVVGLLWFAVVLP